LIFFEFQWAAGTWNIHHPDLQKKTVLVTGGCSGIGLETAKELASLNGQVVIGTNDDESHV
jgi:NAD(P)-dependent dehydrogenase (short-subunit alcohol dehydrogenase family)